MTKNYTNIGNDALMVSALSLLMAGTANATETANCTTMPTCATLGYTQTLAQCGGKFTLKCPLGEGYFCGGTTCSAGQPYLVDKKRCAVCEDYGLISSPDQVGVACKKTNVAVTGTKLSCYDDCTVCGQGYSASSNECVVMGTTCSDFGHYAPNDKPSNLTCGSITIEGTDISCYNANDCSVYTPNTGGSTTPVLTEAQCRNKYPPKTCFLNVGTPYSSSDMSNDPECLKYGFLKTCAEWTFSDCPGGSC